MRGRTSFPFHHFAFKKATDCPFDWTMARYARTVALREIRNPMLLPRLCLEVEIDERSDSNLWTTLEGSLAHGGVFVATHHTVREGTFVALKMTVLGAVHEAVGEVRWVQPYRADSDGHAGLGVQFVDVTPEVLRALRRFVAFVRSPLLCHE